MISYAAAMVLAGVSSMDYLAMGWTNYRWLETHMRRSIRPPPRAIEVARAVMYSRISGKSA